MKLRVALLAALVTATAAACGTGGGAAADPNAPLIVGVSPTPHGQILQFVADKLAPAKGLKIQVKEFTDYVTPNTSLVDKSLDANYFQHQPYLADFEQSHGVQLSWVTAVHLEPLGLYSKKAHKPADLPDGAKIGVPNDTSNEARAFKLLADNGLLKLKPGTESTATPRDVADNPKHLRFVELEAAQLPRSLEDTDASIVNGNYALSAGLDTKSAVLIEKAQGNPNANGLVTRPELAGDKRVKELAELLNSPQVKDYIDQTFHGSVLPAF